MTEKAHHITILDKASFWQWRCGARGGRKGTVKARKLFACGSLRKSPERLGTGKQRNRGIWKEKSYVSFIFTLNREEFDNCVLCLQHSRSTVDRMPFGFAWVCRGGRVEVAQSLSHVWLFATPRTVACQAPLPMGFSRQEYWSGLSFPTPGDLPDQGSNPRPLHLLHWQADS